MNQFGPANQCATEIDACLPIATKDYHKEKMDIEGVKSSYGVGDHS
jgi:hypothetical protein